MASEMTVPPHVARLAPSNLPLLPSTGSRSTGTRAAYFKPLDGAVKSVALEQGDLPVTTENNGVDAAGEFQMGTNNPDPNVDLSKLRRTVSNRLSAQRSRTRKLQHIYDMEKRVKTLEAEIAALTPQVMFQIHQQKLLKMENHFLNQQIITCTENNMIKMAQLEEHKAEVIMLRQLHMTQHQQIHGQTRTPGLDN